MLIFAMDEDPFTSRGSALSLLDPFEERCKAEKRGNSSSDRGVQLSDPFADFSDATNVEKRPQSKRYKPGVSASLTITLLILLLVLFHGNQV